VIGNAHWTRKQGKWRLFFWGAAGQSQLIGEVSRNPDGGFVATLADQSVTNFATLADARAFVLAACRRRTPIRGGKETPYWKDL
jgi:hypothetical protein